MIEIRGERNTALCYCSTLEETAEAQIRALCDRNESVPPRENDFRWRSTVKA